MNKSKMIGARKIKGQLLFKILFHITVHECFNGDNIPVNQSVTRRCHYVSESNKKAAVQYKQNYYQKLF